MRFVVRPPRAGDIVRVRLGEIYHYGIFASKREVVQFGLPPVAKRSGEELRVLKTDLATFACGNPVEAEECDDGERKARFSPWQTVKRARKRLGEGGYNLLHNNCEHFAYECAFGVRYSEQEEEAKRRAQNRRLDVYLVRVPETEETEPLYPPERQAYVDRCKDEDAKKERYYVWRLLEYALLRSYGKKIRDLTFSVKDGKWSCEGYRFSLGHSHGVCAVALSDGRVGIDVEEERAFYDKFPLGSEKARAAREEIAREEEKDDLLTLWVKKEAAFKAGEERPFSPKDEDTTKESFVTYRWEGFVVAVCGEYADRIRKYEIRW